MATDHAKAGEELAKLAKDPDVKAWAGKTLPMLEDHKQQAHQVYAAVGGKDRNARKERKEPAPSAAPRP